jgi:hypothetical protein
MSPRTRLSLDGPWNFSPSAQPAAGDWSSITVPSPWQADARFRDHTGAACYRRELEIPAEWLEHDRALILGFGAVDYFAEVWLNDVRVGEHEGGYLPFEFDITSAARAGANVLTVRVDDPIEIFPEIPHGKQSWYGLLSGIWQPVWVESRSATYIQHVRITPVNDMVNISISLSRPLAPDQSIALEIMDPSGVSVAESETSSLNYQLPLTSPHLWHPDSPNLYTLKVSTSGDEMIETFGFRTVETKDGQILLNGRPFYLRAALDQDYYPELISTPPSLEYIEDQFRKAKEMGLNCLRVHIKVADPRYYAAADKAGLLIWTELPNHILLTEDARRRARETLAGMVERDWNHPSIGIWTIINESWGIDLTDPSQRAWLAETYDWLKTLDPTRLVVGNSACWGNFHVATDIADFHIYYAMPDHHRQWRAWTESYARRPGWLFAHEYHDHAAWREFLRDPWRAAERPLAPEVRLRGDEPLLVSEFGNWGLPDVKKLREGNGGGAPWWFDTGLEWGDGIVYPRGMEQRFRDYYLDRVFPSLSALAEASQRLQYDALKFEIENIRSHQSIQGYVITEFTDLHWECNGLLDMYRNPKVHYPLLKQINADDLLIPLWERLVFASGEACALRICLSHYSAVEVEQALLEWELIHDGSRLQKGQLAVGEASSSGVTDLGVVGFEAPAVEAPVRAQLQLRLRNNGDVLAAAEQEIYLFPAELAPARAAHGMKSKQSGRRRVHSPEFQSFIEDAGHEVAAGLDQADVAVVTRLDDSCRQFLLRGGRVLLLAETDDALQTHIPGVGIEPRAGTPWQGDWASSFGWHRFEDLPTDRIVNFAFADLTPEHIVQGFAPRDFALDVYAGLFVGWLHKPVPTIVRKRLGRGELLVSTFRLTKHLGSNPLASYLFSMLLDLIA